MSEFLKRRTDPDETEGRRLYRARADREAAMQMVGVSRPVRLSGRRCEDGSIMPEDGACPHCHAISGEICRAREDVRT